MVGLTVSLLQGSEVLRGWMEAEAAAAEEMEESEEDSGMKRALE